MQRAGLALAGMMLSYYRMPYYYAAFVLCWLLFWALGRWRLNGRAWLAGAAARMASPSSAML